MPTARLSRIFGKKAGAAARLELWALAGLAALAALPADAAPGRPPGEPRGELFAPPAVAFERLDAENLLPQSSVYDLTERADGYLWMVTLDGLVRFDGLRQRIFDRNSHPELETTRFSALADDPARDTLWIGAEDGRLLALRGDHFVTYPPTDPRLGAITALRLGAGGRLFVFHQVAAEVVEETGGRLRRIGAAVTGRGAYSCGAALFGDDGRFWQAGEEDLFAIPLPAELGPVTDGEQCQRDAAGGFWLRAEGGGLWRAIGRDLWRESREGQLPPGALPFAEDRAGNLWVKLANVPRLGRLDAKGRLHRYGEAHGVDPKGAVVRAAFDREGNLWIASNTALYRYLGEAIGGLELRHPGGEAEVMAQYEASDGSTWLATRDQRLWRLGSDGRLEELTSRDAAGQLRLRPDRTDPGSGGSRSPVPAPKNFKAFAESGGSLWIGVDSGLLRWRGGRLTLFSEAWQPPPTVAGAVNDIRPEGEGLWLATTETISRFEGDEVVRSWGPAEGVPAGALTLLRGRGGTLWAGTRAGVLRLAGERFETLPGLGPEIGQARWLWEDDEGRLWVGTYARGLYRRLPSGEVEHVGPPQGFPASGVFTMKLDAAGFLWTTSNRGLLRTRLSDVDRLLSGTAGRAPSVLYGRAAGLPSSECNGGFAVAGYACRGIAAADRERPADAWCVQTLGGIAVAHLDRMAVNRQPPVPVIEDALVEGRARSIDGGVLEIGPQDRNLLVRFTGIAFDGAREVNFRYWLSGYDQGWVDTGGRREALFGDLPPGEYHLEVVAESRDGLVSPRPARLLIRVAPAWWERGSVRALALLAAAGLVWAAMRLRLLLLSRRHARRVRELRAAAEQLEQRVRERTAELDAEVAERRRAEAEARSASAAKSAFLAQMSHELRTPMNAIIGLSEMLVRTPLAEQQREWVATVCSSGEALLSIIEDILDFSRIEAGRLEVEARELDPAAVVEEAVKIVGPLAQAKGLEIGWSAGPGVPARVVGDAPRLRQVLLNLLGNAIKFTSRGRVGVRLDAEPTAEGWRLELAVSDTGIGIAPEAQAKVFEPFIQADASMSRRFGGSGLGLAICQRVMGALGGGLRLESRLGEGSTFTIEYPVVRPGAAAAAAPPEPPADDAAISRLRVLVAEDDEVNQLVSQSLLQAIGVEIRLVATGEEALELLDAEPFDVVLMDLHLPGLSGLEASRRLRAELPPERQPFLVALTAAVTPEDRAACREAGMDDFLGKPTREADLRRVLGRAAAARPPAR